MKKKLPTEIHKDPGLLVFRIIEYGLDPDHQFFKISDLTKDLKLNPKEIELINHYMIDSVSQANPNHLIQILNFKLTSNIGVPSHEWILTLLPSAIVTYNEFEEIKLARQNAEDAKYQSIRAYKLAMIAFLVSAVVGLAQIILMIYQLGFNNGR